MNEQYLKERKGTIKRIVIMVIVMTVFVGGILFISLKNTAKYAKGPKDLSTMDISNASGEFVKASFDKMGEPIAEYVYENKDKKVEATTARAYCTEINGKLLIIEVPSANFREFDKVVKESGKNVVECKGMVVPIKLQVKKIAKELLAEELKIKNISEEEFDKYFWPYMMNTDIPKEIGEKGLEKTAIMFCLGIYFFVVIILVAAGCTNIKKLKKKYENNNQVDREL